MTKKNIYKKSDRTFVNPYNFVSIDRKKIKQENIEETYKDKEELHTGYLDCVLVAKTPLAIPDLPEGEESGGESKHDFFSINGNDQKNPMIPGSSLRGMIRSVYETITESCLSTMKPDTHLFSRAGAEQHYEPGILKEKDGEWKLYTVKEIYKIPDKNAYKKEKKIKIKMKLSYRTEIENGVRCLVADDNTKFRMGDSVEKPKIESGMYVSKLSLDNKSDQYVYVGEDFSNKRFERVFEIGKEISDLRENAVKTAMQLLEETLKVYRSTAINKMYPDEHTGYADYEYAKKEKKVIPIWYQKDQKTKKVKLSMACIGRIGYYTTLDDLVKKKVPCQNRKKLCSACNLFGMAREEAVGGRVRITDARAKGEVKWQKNVKLKTLATPRYSYWPFYAKTNSFKYPTDYENPEVEIRGRKYYWHIPGAAHNKNIYRDLRKEEDINQNMQSGYFDLADTGSKFEFRIYYNEITTVQLDELKWTLCLGENQLNGNLCHKLGRGKPLGLGSVKVCIINQTERRLSPEYHLEIENNLEKLGGMLHKQYKSVTEIQRISDFNIMENRKVEYPMILCNENIQESDRAKKNDLASHNWFSENKKEKKVQCLPVLSDDPALYDPALYYYEYVDTSKLNSDRGNATQKGKNRK